MGAKRRYTKAMEPRKAAVRPLPGEYAPYYETYISLVKSDDILAALEAQRLLSAQLFAARSERDGNFRYAPDKWTVKEVLGHLSDSERIFAYRAVRIARGDQTPLSGFEQDDYVRGGNFSERALSDLAEEFDVVRAASINKTEISVRALAYIIAGHELHHRRILDERYFPAIPRA